MENSENLNSVLEANKNLLRRARELNARAGKEIFLVPTAEQLTELVKVCLAGARCASEVTNVECLRLPSLDEVQKARVLADCPDTIVVLGKERGVTYPEGKDPAIMLNTSEVVALLWKDLPDEGVRLPGGRLVRLVMNWNLDRFEGSDIPELKRQLSERANEDQWLRFTAKPEIVLPDPFDPNSRVQRVKAVQYGTCVVTGKPLVAYGYSGVNHGRWGSTSPYYKAIWTRDEGEANLYHDEAVEYLDRIRVQEHEKIEKKQRMDEAMTIQLQVRDLYNAHGHDPAMPQNLRDRLYSVAWEFLHEDSSADWANKAQQLMVQVKAATEKIQADRAVDEKAKELAEARNLEVYGITGGLLDVAKAMADRAIERHGNGAEEIFEEELTAPYGRERRQDAIRGRLGNGGATSDFYNLSRASDVDAVLEAAIKIVNEQRIAVAVKKASSSKPQTPANPKNFDMGQLFGGVAREAKRRGGKRSKR